jgi:Rho-binding antiterminator
MLTIQALGALPKAKHLIRNDTRIVLFPEVSVLPLFLIDAAIFFSGADAGAKELLKRSGRPAIDFTAEPFDPDLLYTDYRARLQALPRTNYQPIDCNFYDNFEAAIVTRRVVDLVYLDPFGEAVTAATGLKDLKTKLTEEFIQLESGEWLRLDRIVSVDGNLAGVSCRF